MKRFLLGLIVATFVATAFASARGSQSSYVYGPQGTACVAMSCGWDSGVVIVGFGLGNYIGAPAEPNSTITLSVRDVVNPDVGAGYAFYGPDTRGVQVRTPFCDGSIELVVPSWATWVVLEVQTASPYSQNFCGEGADGVAGEMTISG